MLSVSLLIGFLHKVHNNSIEKQKYSILIVIELGTPVSESSTGSRTFISQNRNRKLVKHTIQCPTHDHITMLNH